MKLTNEEISTVMDKTIKEIGAAHRNPSMLPEETKEFGNQLADSKTVSAHIHAIILMEKFAEKLTIPVETSRLASFVAAAWIGYKLKEAELAKNEVADLNRMVA